MKKCLFILLIFLIGCAIFATITFDEVSQPYREKYGDPEEVNEYKSDDYHVIDWWWWSQGFMVSFSNTEYDDVNGWKVDHTYSF